MSVVEKVDAEVRFEVGIRPKGKRHYSIYDPYRELPNDSTTVKALEDFLFSVRMRGGGDDTKVQFETKRFWDGVTHKEHLTALKVKVQATMDGYAALPAEQPKKGLSYSHLAYARVAGGATAGGVVMAVLTRIF